MVDIPDSLDAHRQQTRQGFAHVGGAETFIWSRVSIRPFLLKTRRIHTVGGIRRFNVDMEVFVSLKGLLEQLDFLVAFNPSTLCIGATLPIPFILI